MSLKKNTVWNLAGSGLPLLLAAVAVPFIIRHAGVEAFGILTMVWALIGYFSLFDFGLGRALTQQVARQLSINPHAEIPSLVKSGLLFTLSTGILGGAVLLALSYPLAHEWLKISPTLQQQAFIALMLASLGIPLTTLTTGLRGILEAYEDFKSVNIFRILLGATNFGLPALTVYCISTSLVWMVLSLVLARLLNVLAYVWLVQYKLQRGWWRKGALDRSTIKMLLTFGAWMTVSNVISPIMITADRFIVSGLLGAAVVAYYTVPSEMMQRVLILPAALTSVLFPRLTVLLHTQPDEAQRVYRRALKLVTVVMLPICLLIAACSYWGLKLWLGQSFAQQSWMVMVILSIGIFFNSVASVPFTKIQAGGHAKTTAAIHLFEVLIYGATLILLTKLFGLTGTASAWTLRAAMDLLLLMRFEAKKGEVKQE